LSTVYGIVTQSGGAVSVESAPGAGSTFTIFLPRAEEPPETTAPAPGAARAGHGAETLLLVEDEEGVRDLAREVLEARGYRVLAAANGAEALAVFRAATEPFDLIVTDVIMPQMGGKELAERLAAERPGLKVLFMSGYTDEAIAQHGVLDRQTALLEKPFTPDTLARKVREVLDSR
jgi:CheY-like chemotaxis protein